MAKATGAQTGLAYVKETSWGVTPSSPTMKELRVKDEDVDLNKGNLRSEAIKSNRMITDVIHGIHEVAGPINCEFGDYLDDWLEAALFGTLSAGVLKLAQVQNSFTLERRLNSLHRVMQYSGVLANGLTLALEPEAIAQISFPVVGKTMVTDTDALGGPNGWLVNEPITPPAIGETSFDIDAGTTDPAANDTFMVYQTASPNSPRSEQIYTVSSFAAGTVTFSPALDVALVDNDIVHFIRPSTAVTTSEPMDSFSGTITEGGSALAIATKIDLEINQGIEPAKVLGSNLPNDLIETAVVVTGTLSAFVEDFALFSKFLNETNSSLQFAITDGTTTYTWLLPKIKYTGAKINKPAGGSPIVEALPFEAVYDTTEGTSVKITKA